MYKSIYILIAFSICILGSCDNNVITSVGKTVNKTQSCSYIPKELVLINIDSLIRVKGNTVLDSIYKTMSNRTDTLDLYLNTKMIRKYSYTRDFLKGRYFIDKSDSIISENKWKNDKLKADFYYEKGYFILLLNKRDSAITYFKNAIKIYDMNNKHICIEKLNCLGFISIAHVYYGGNLDSARHYLELQENYFSNKIESDGLVYRNYYTQATVHKRLHNFSLSLTYINLALKKLEETEPIDSNRISLTYTLKASIEYDHYLYDQSLSNYKKATLFGVNNSLRVKKHIYTGIINTLTQLDSIGLAYKYIDTIRSIDLTDKNTLALSYKLIGLIHKNNINLSMLNYKKAIDIYESINNYDPYQYAETCYLYSNRLEDMEMLDEGIKYSKNSIYTYFDTIDISYDILSNDPKSILYLSQLASLNSTKFKKSNNYKDKKRTIELFQLVDSLIYFYHRNFDDDVILSNQYDLGDYYLDKFEFYFQNYSITKNRENINEFINTSNSYKGKALLKERFLNIIEFSERDTILVLKTKIDEVKFKIEEKSGNLDSLNLALNDILLKLEIFKRQASNNVILKSQNNILKKVERYCIENNTILVDYFTTNTFKKNKGYVFVSNGYNSSLICIDRIDELLEESDRLFSLLSSYSEDTLTINSLSSNLYKGLLFFLDEFSKNEIESIIVIPNNTLCKIPFELLLSNKKETLLENYNVSYAYSIKNLLLSSVDKTNNNDKVLVFSHSNPKTISNSSLDTLFELPGAYLEAKEIKKIYKENCKAFTGYDASIKNFIKYARDYPIIHLALHGRANNFSRFKSKLFFRNKNSLEVLYPHELKKYKIEPNLLVLSACETATGKLYNYESMYSIARAFYANGAKKVISSLWELDDESSKQILTEFYNQISDESNTNYSHALRMAKLKFFRKNKISKNRKSYIGGLILYN